MVFLLAALFPMAYVAADGAPLRFELKRIEMQTRTCAISIEYPEIISAASAEARERINAGIRRALLRQTSWPASDSGQPSLEAYADGFLNACAGNQSRPEIGSLSEHKRVTIFRYTPPILSFRVEASGDVGGAHPFGTTFFVNFESGTGKTILLTDLFNEPSLGKLNAMAEKTFRRDHGLSPTESLREQAFSFPQDRFSLNDNFGIGESGLVFFFNTYEISAGAMGPAQITMPFVILRDILRLNLASW
jgi:hypothetical protein